MTPLPTPPSCWISTTAGATCLTTDCTDSGSFGADAPATGTPARVVLVVVVGHGREDTGDRGSADDGTDTGSKHLATAPGLRGSGYRL